MMATKNCSLVVQKLWRNGILCGKERKNRKKKTRRENFLTRGTVAAGKRRAATPSVLDYPVISRTENLLAN